MDYQMLKKNFENHGFMTEYFKDREEVIRYLKGSIQDKTIGLGGSITIKELNLDQELASENRVIWHWNEPGRETLINARDTEVYICSANGVSETGELVNIDGTGNRVSMTLFGPSTLYFIIGRNKIASDLEGALARAKNIASPKNAVRLAMSTPCVANHGDKCYDCNSPQRICRGTVILERPMIGMEVIVLFVDEDLGY